MALASNVAVPRDLRERRRARFKRTVPGACRVGRRIEGEFRRVAVQSNVMNSSFVL